MKFSLLIPCRDSAAELQKTVDAATAHFDPRHRGQYEIILIPNGLADLSAADGLARVFADRYPHVRVVPHRGEPGKGAALQTGYRAARGEWIFFTDADLPFDLTFFDRAAELLAKDVEFVTGNRRLPDTHFTLPVRLLPLAYGRHRLGLIFNTMARVLFGFRTHDTQAGIKAMSARFARAAFGASICPGFFFDVEFFLVAKLQGFEHADLPVKFFLRNEKSTVRILRESILGIYWLLRIAVRRRLGHYRKSLSPERTCDDWGISPATNEAMLELVRNGIANRVSVLVDAPHVRHGWDDLLALERIGKVKVGLHYNLTYGERGLGGPAALLRAALGLGGGAVEFASGASGASYAEYFLGELERQTTMLRELGVTPRALDGHHHAHIFPGVWSVIRERVLALGYQRVRLPLDPRLLLTTKAPVALFALWVLPSFRRLSRQGKLSYRFCLYPTGRDLQSSAHLSQLLSRYPEREVILHPAARDDFAAAGWEDSYRGERVREFELWKSQPAL